MFNRNFAKLFKFKQPISSIVINYNFVNIFKVEFDSVDCQVYKEINDIRWRLLGG